MGRALICGMLAVSAMLYPAAGTGQTPDGALCRLCASAGDSARPAAPIRPLQIAISAQLDFSRLVHRNGGGGGSVVIDPDGGAARVSGLDPIGGPAMRGEVVIEGEPGRTVRITIPNRMVLTAADGSSIDIVGIKANVGPVTRLGSDGRLAFAFGGRLNVTARAAGLFRGRIPITADYQ